MGVIRGFQRQWRNLFKDRRIAYLELTGMIAEQRAISNAPQVIDLLDEVEKQEFRVLLLHINSPGGTVGATQGLYERLMRLKREHGVKLVISLGDVAASGGIYTAMAGDRIIANGGTVTGSIGVIIKSGNFRQLLDKIGIQSDVVKSGPFKDILSAERALSDEERALLQDTVDDTYQQFVNTVATARQLTHDQVRGFADGRIFTGRQAKEYGLVDAIGGPDTAVDTARELAGISSHVKPDLVHLQKKKSMLARLLTGDTRLGLPPKSSPAITQWLSAHEALAGIPLWLMPRPGI